MKRAVIHYFSNFLFLLSLLLTQVEAAVLTEQSLAEAEKLFNADQVDEAYQTLELHIDDMAGDIEFDYLLARSALATNRFRVAIDALNRILSVDPAFVGARIELAKTYYGQGVKQYSRSALEQSRAEFLNILKFNPPEPLKPAIEAYLQSIQSHLEKKTLLGSLYIEAGVGYDSNINSGPYKDIFNYYDPFLPGTFSLKMDPITRPKNSPFLELKSGGGLTMPLRKRNVDLFANIDVAARGHTDQDVVGLNYGSASMEFGIRHYGPKNRKTIFINPRFTRLDGNRYLDSFSLNVQWEQLIDARHRLTLRLRGGDSNLEGKNYNGFDSLWPMSVSGARVSAGWTTLHGGDSKASTYVALSVGHDGETGCNFCVTPYRRYVRSLYLEHGRRLSQQTSAYVNALIEGYQYEEDFFFMRRRDYRSELAMGLRRDLSKTWSLHPGMHLINQQSNVDLFDFKRAVFVFSSRWTY